MNAPKANAPSLAKRILGQIPLAAEIDELLIRRGQPLNRGFDLSRTRQHLAEWKMQAGAAQAELPAGQPVLIFATLRYWIEHAVLLGMALAGQGAQVTLAYLPYTSWFKPLQRYDQRRQERYARSVLAQAAPQVRCVSWYDVSVHRQDELKPPYGLPGDLALQIEALSQRDVQYTLQIEEVDLTGDLYHMRLRRNVAAAHAMLRWLHRPGADRPKTILTPNGSILEMGAVYAVARHLGIPVVTYEFGEQRDRIWLAHNAEVMLQETDALWQAYADRPLQEEEWQKVRALFAARQGANLWQNFSRRWQGQPSQGGEQARLQLHLDERPVVLLAANVIGDSLTLGRQVFSASMTQWLQRTIQYFLEHPQYQFVVRIHPGERFTKGPSVANVVRAVVDPLPEHIHLVEANDPTNTYDIVQIADAGLVYTTTTGMEMAMNGVAVVVTGKTHYRAKGFTLDPNTWDEYFAIIEKVLADPAAWKLTREQVERAWTYAYRFFFNYPVPFPWHLVRFWDDLPTNPLDQVISPAGQSLYGEAFRLLAGKPRSWEMQQPVGPVVSADDIRFSENQES